MKRIISLILAVIMVFASFSVAASATEELFASGVVYTDDGAVFTWEIPAEGETLFVNGEGDMPAFTETPQWLSYSFKNLVIGEGITSVSEEAFLFAADLEKVELSSTVKRIKERAFYGCDKLKSVKFANVQRVGAMAFYGCMSFTKIEIPETLDNIGNYAFGYFCDEFLDDALAKIEGTAIHAYAGTAAQRYAVDNEIAFVDLDDHSRYFTYYLVNETDAVLETFTEIEYTDNVNIPETIDGYDVIGLGDNLFAESKVKTVFVPSSVTEISESAFTDAKELTEILVEKGGVYASFDGILYSSNYKKLIKVPEGKEVINRYPEELKIIGSYSFVNSVIESVELPQTVTKLEIGAFAFSNMKKVVLPQKIKSISEKCFAWATSLNEVVLPDGLTEIGTNAFSNCAALQEIAFPNGLEKIDGAAFHCAGLKSVIIPESVKEIGGKAFGYYSAEDIEFVKDEAFIIKGKNDTPAESYADENGFTFKNIAPKQPKIWLAYADNIGITIFWNEIDGAEKYEVYRKTAKTSLKKIATVGKGEEAVYNDINVKSGVTYTYSIVAVKDDFTSVSKATASVEFFKLSTPEMKSAEMTKDGVLVKWNTVSSADGYILYRKTNSGKWTEIATFKGKVKSFEDKTCKSGKTYTYTVKAYKDTIESGCDYNGVSSVYLGIPKLRTAENATKGIKITWSKVSGATGYIIGRKTSSTGWTKIAQVKDVNTYNDKTAKAGTAYTYTVVPVKGSVSGFYSEKGVTCRCIPKVTTKGAANTADGVKVTWKPVSDCSGYSVYRKTEKGDWKKIATVKGSTKSYYVDKKAKSGTKYYYTVKAYSGSYLSAYDTSGVSRYYIEAPTLLKVKSDKKGITTKWEAVSGASGYYVYRATGSGSYKKIATVKGAAKSSYLDKTAKKGKTYKYKIKAYYSKTESAYSNVKSIKDKY